MSGGLSFQGGERDYIGGPNVGMTLSLRPAARFGARFDLNYHHITKWVTITYDCFIPEGCGQPTLTGDALDLVTATAAVVLVEHPHNDKTFYWTAGLGVYGVTESPYDGAYARPGWNVGGGFSLGKNVFVDVRYHQLIRPATFRHLVPLTFGVRF
jgi:hypothetical protein